MRVLNIILLVLCAITLGLCIFLPEKGKYKVEVYEKYVGGTMSKFDTYIMDDTTGIYKRFPSEIYGSPCIGYDVVVMPNKNN